MPFRFGGATWHELWPENDRDRELTRGRSWVKRHKIRFTFYSYGDGNHRAGKVETPKHNYVIVWYVTCNRPYRRRGQSKTMRKEFRTALGAARFVNKERRQGRKARATFDLCAGFMMI